MGLLNDKITQYCDVKKGFELINENLLNSGEKISINWNFQSLITSQVIIQLKYDTQLIATINDKEVVNSFDFIKYGIKTKINEGTNNFIITLHNPTEQKIDAICEIRILDTQGTIIPNINNYTPAVGAKIKSAGRFGYTKGDGILDCSMSAFGVITRPHVFGFSEYKQNALWQLSLLPPGVESSCSTGLPKRNYSISDNEVIDVDWAGVNWKRSVIATEDYLNRKKGDIVDISFSYSLLTPFILIETNDYGLRINPEHYSKISLPLKSGNVIRNSHNGVFYNREIDGDLIENRILLWGNSSFPDIPLVVILKSSPEKITDDIDIIFKEKVDWAMFGFPFGFELFKAEKLNYKWHQKAMELLDFWHPIALSRPTKCEEYFQIQDNKIEILQHFKYRKFKDSLGTINREFAPFPPVLGIKNSYQVQLDDRLYLTNFPTKYGYMQGVLNSNYNSYTLPIPSYKSEYPLTSKKVNFDDFEQYVNYHKTMPKVMNPGAHSFLYHWTIPLRMFAQLPDNQLTKLKELSREGLKKACNKNETYIGPNGSECCMWYTRTEPFTKVQYLISYLHVGGYRWFKNTKRETVENFNSPLIEIDWGNALALYAIYNGALHSNSWDIIKENWTTIKKTFDYFLVLQDWCCMTSAYCENGNAWSDGTNYGAFISFIQMAEIVGEEESYKYGIYAYAKMCAERMALFSFSKTYLPKFYKKKSFMASKFFSEETYFGYHTLCYPEILLHGRYRNQAIYNITTEGLYSEALQMYAKQSPKLTKKLLKNFEKAFGDKIFEYKENVTFHSEGDEIGTHEVFSYILLAFYSKYKSLDELNELLEKAYINNRLPKDILGSLQSYRKIPMQWSYRYLKSVLSSEKLPKITTWKNIEFEEINYPTIRLKKLGIDAWIEFSTELPISCHVNNEQYDFDKSIKIIIKEDSIISFK